MSEMSDTRDFSDRVFSDNPKKKKSARLILPPGLYLPEGKQERKEAPMCTGVLDYFAAALFEVARVSFIANQQHNPGQEMHWAWGKSNDHADCIIRHLADRGGIDSDKLRHSGKLAWRSLALLTEELVDAGLAIRPRAAR